jgi:hypothetical protein
LISLRKASSNSSVRILFSFKYFPVVFNWVFYTAPLILGEHI